MRHLERTSLRIALALMLGSSSVIAGQTAATLYALNCMGCHSPPEAIRYEPPFRIGQFAQTEKGRVFFIRVVDADGKAPSREQDAHLLREILTWKKSCPVVIQEASFLQYTGPR